MGSEFADGGPGGVGVIASGGEVQQPGTLVRMNPPILEQKPSRVPLPEGKYINEMASDSYGMFSIFLAQAIAYQLLPADPYRKIARIQVTGFTGSLGALVGTMQAIDSAAGRIGAALINSFSIPGVFTLTSIQHTSGTPYFEYTSKAPLWVCAATTVDVGVTAVQAIAERFNSGTPVT